MLVYQNEDLEVFHRPGPSSFTLCTFGHLGFRSEGKRYWGSQRVDGLDLDCLGFVAKADNWYPATSMRAACLAIAALLKRPTILFGHSMGAYAAIKYSRMLGAIGSIASSPMVSIDPEAVPSDRRFHGYFDPVKNAEMGIEDHDISGRIILPYDRFDTLDRFHTEQIRARLSRLETLNADFYGHEAVQVLLDKTIFTDLLESIATGREISIDIAARIRKNKRTNIKYLASLVSHLAFKSASPKSKYAMIRSLVEKVQLLDPKQSEWKIHVICEQILSQSQQQQGNFAGAAFHIERALEIQRLRTGNIEPNMQARLAKLRAY